MIGVIALMTSLVLLAAALAPGLAHWAQEPVHDDYKFLITDALGRAYRWNPCEPIHYVVNLGTAPSGSMQDVQEAVRRVSAATGIPFVYDGATDEIPTRERSAFQPDRYGGGWAPVVIAWITPTQTDIAFQKDGHTAAGVASPEVANASGTVYVSGWVVINANDNNGPGFSSYGEQGPVVQHELSHILGLGHVKQWGELMEPSGGGVTDFGAGDLEGLRLLGASQGCLATPSPPSG